MGEKRLENEHKFLKGKKKEVLKYLNVHNIHLLLLLFFIFFLCNLI